MRFTTIAAATVLAGVALGSVFAATGGTHDSRIALMKKNGAAAGALAAIAKGDKPFDAAAVKAALTTIAETTKAFPDEFGPGSDMKDSEVNQKIWANIDDFRGKADKLVGTVQTALADPPADQAAVGALLKNIGAGCGACHEIYRVKKD